MKTLILILIIVWSIIGAAYSWIDMCHSMDIEATLDPGDPTPLSKTIAYGPLIWLFYIIGYIVIHAFILLNDVVEFIRSRF